MTLIQATKIIGLKVITLQGGRNDDVIASTGDMVTREILDIAEQKWAI